MNHFKSALCAFFAVLGTHAILLSVFFALMCLADRPNLAMTVMPVMGVAAVAGWILLEKNFNTRTEAHRAAFPVAIALSSLVVLAIDTLALNVLDVHRVYTLYLLLLLLLITALFAILRIFIELVTRARHAINR